MNLNFAKIPAFTFLPDAPRQAGARQDSAQEARTQGRSLMSRLAAMLAFVTALPRRQRQTAELENFSDRELADIGLNRGDIARVHDPKFAADYAARRPNALYFPKA